MVLHILRNGFDRAHDLPTSYWDFRKYILTLYPDAESYYFIPESTLMPKGNEEYDEDCFHDVYTNEDLSEHILNTFVGVNDLFVDWVKNELGDIDFYGIKKPEIEAMIDSNAFFLSFNYTKTLELGYGINEDQVCHIHGSVESLPNEIIMGHGNDEPVTEHSYSIGTEASFEKLKRKLRASVTWYINSYDSHNNPEFRDKIKAYGFKVKVEAGW